jgi:hypothetical protein
MRLYMATLVSFVHMTNCEAGKYLQFLGKQPVCSDILMKW